MTDNTNSNTSDVSETKYNYDNRNWKCLGSFLVYVSNGFQFKQDILITELDECIIDAVTPLKFYKFDGKVSIKNDEFVKKLRKENMKKSIVIISNQVNNSQLNHGAIKNKVRLTLQMIKIPIVGIFSMKQDQFMKPHTGSWKFLSSYYRKFGNTNIRTAVVVSDEGGLSYEYEATNGDIEEVVVGTDIDRAFANNISQLYLSINEYMNPGQKDSYKWDDSIISPEIRKHYIQQCNKMPKINFAEELIKMGNYDSYVIMLMGYPRCGKSTVVEKIMQDWRKSKLDEMHAVEVLGHEEYTKSRIIKVFKNKIIQRYSVIIDGRCHTEELRKPFLQFLMGKNIPVLVVDVHCGKKMSMLLNHVKVETTTNRPICLHKKRNYDIYEAEATYPRESKMLKFVKYVPHIKDIPQIVRFRY